MSLNIDIASLRKEYSLRSLSETNVAADPVTQFSVWWNEAHEALTDEANAMTLATCDTQGNPSARIVLLKGFSDEGFVFYTNYESRKGQQLMENPKACLVFFWRELERQVRIEGTVTKTAARTSDAYFASRPVLSRISACASPQSLVVENREVLERRVEQFQIQYKDNIIPRPENWGGYIVAPNKVEFWQGRQSRLHDRIQYRTFNGSWIIERLAP